MQLDDMKRVWQEQDRKLDLAIALNTRQLRDSVFRKVRWRLGWLALMLAFDLAFGVVLVVLFGSFLGDHIGEPRFAVPAAVLLALVVALSVPVVRQLAAMGSIDYGASVLEIQRHLESLRLGRVRAAKWTALAVPLAWTPLLIVSMKGLLGIDVFGAFDPAWVAGNLAFGLIAAGAMVWAARRWGDRLGRTPFGRDFVRDLAGYNVNAASDFLHSLERFEGDAAYDDRPSPLISRVAVADIVHEFPICAPRRVVFDKISTPAGLDGWWTQTCAGEPRIGAEYELGFGPGYAWRGRVERCTPDEEFALRITSADDDWQGTRVGFLLQDADNGTRVRFEHSGWPEANAHYRASCYCWAMYLRLLTRLIEHGEFVAYERRLSA